jgi:hypothetical protein
LYADSPFASIQLFKRLGEAERTFAHKAIVWSQGDRLEDGMDRI